MLIPGGDEYFHRITVKIGYITLIIGWASFPIVISLMVLLSLLTNLPRIYAARKEYYNEKIGYLPKKPALRKILIAIGEFMDRRQEGLRRKKELEGGNAPGGSRKKSFWEGFTLKNALGFAVLIPMVGLASMMWMPFGFHFLSLGIDGVLSPDDGKYWPSANALVLKSGMKRVRVTTSGRTTSTVRRYDLTVVVEYRVLGKIHSLNKRNFGGFHDEKGGPGSIERLPAGKIRERVLQPVRPRPGVPVSHGKARHLDGHGRLVDGGASDHRRVGALLDPLYRRPRVRFWEVTPAGSAWCWDEGLP